VSAWTVIQVLVDVGFALGLFVVIMRINRAPKDDPRLSRGLQLLQSKISVLEDLSDRTETQVAQLTSILEQKAREVQAKVQLAEKSVHEIRLSMERSLDVAKIFQDKIPHKEIIERQKTIKYVQAARYAHQGMSPDEISEKIDLPKGEIEFIASVNREQLVFSEDQLPAWASESTTSGIDDVSPTSSSVSSSMSREGGAISVAQPLQAAPMADQQGSYIPMRFEGVGFHEGEAAGYGNDQQNSEYSDGQEDSVIRLRAEMELAESQRLVENLSRLKFEMQNLDMQLADTHHPSRDLSKVFEAIESPKASGSSLEKLGEEFRKAVLESKENETNNFDLSKPDRQGFVELAPDSPSTYGAEVSAPAEETAISAREKVQAALRAGRAAQNAAMPQRQANPELDAARALAKEQVFAGNENQLMPATPHIVRSGPIRSTEPPVIRRVQFPKIDSEY
jgi:hypothetical protein